MDNSLLSRKKAFVVWLNKSFEWDLVASALWVHLRDTELLERLVFVEDASPYTINGGICTARLHSTDWVGSETVGMEGKGKFSLSYFIDKIHEDPNMPVIVEVNLGLKFTHHIDKMVALCHEETMEILHDLGMDTSPSLIFPNEGSVDNLLEYCHLLGRRNILTNKIDKALDNRNFEEIDELVYKMRKVEHEIEGYPIPGQGVPRY